jgi:DNA repair protein RadC
VKVKEVSAQELVAGAEKPQKLAKLQLFKVRLVKDRSLAFAVTKIMNSSDLAKIARSELGNLPHEEVIAIGLDGQNHPIGVVKVSQGGLHGAALTPSDTIRPLVAMGASAFVLAHNHPSGDPRPSEDDIAMTRALKTAAGCVGISFLDHLIIGSVRGGGKWNSLREMGIM